MKKYFHKFRLSSWSVAIGSIALFLAACGDEVTTQVIQDSNMSIVSTTKELPKCTKDNEGEQAFVKGETAPRVCMDGKWFATSSGGKDTVVVKEKSTCTTKELKDKSGVKIICGGDSVGVVLNGKQGEKGDKGDVGAAGKDGSNGKDGAGCSVVTLADNSGLKVICGGDSVGVVLNGAKGDAGKDGSNGKDGTNGKDGINGKDGVGCSVASKTDSTVTIACGTDKFTMSLGGGSAVNPDTGNVVYEIENASISGVSQKGPFVKGATVTAFELDGSKSLLQTGRTFVGNITQDDGRFNMSNVTLKSSYVRLSANGYYRNEVSGKNSTAPITLNAVTDLDARNTVNVNLLTHLEYDRVAHLMAQGDGTLKIKKLKKQAEGEIFKAFHMDGLADFGYSEDLDVFGKTDADAALLAISVLLQGDRDEAGLTALLTGFSNDFKDGTWDSAQVKAEIADWAIIVDDNGKLGTYRANVKGWGLSSTVPAFEKYIRRFASVENGLGVCGSDSVPVGTVKHMTNVKSMYYSSSYLDTISHSTNPFVGKARFICVDVDSAKWRFATLLEADRYANPENKKDGSLMNGPISGQKIVWDADTLRYAKNSEIRFSLGCTSYNKGFFQKTAESDYAEYGFVCKENSEWDSYVTIQRIESKYGKIKDERDGKSYYTITIGEQTWMAENLSFDYKVKGATYGTYTNTDNGETYGRYYTWAAAMDSAGVYSDNSKGCGNKKTCTVTTPARGICPTGWHIPTSNEWNTLYSAIGSSPYAMQAKGCWSDPKDTYGFSALPAGRYSDGGFSYVGSTAHFWSATEYASSNADLWYLGASDARLSGGIKYGGYSVRCLKDSEE